MYQPQSCEHVVVGTYCSLQSHVSYFLFLVGVCEQTHMIDVQMIKGFANVFAGGEGLFMTTLTGPGVVWLQGQPPDRMISEVARRVPSGGGGVFIGGGGGEGGGGESSGEGSQS